jgi:hypothetical protein
MAMEVVVMKGVVVDCSIDQAAEDWTLDHDGGRVSLDISHERRGEG